MRALSLAISLILTAALLAATSQPQGPIVTVTGGRIAGAWTPSRGAVFKGIPYAQPPVGDLRWREPVPVKAWSGVRNTTQSGPPCAQKPTPMLPQAAELSKEDCLYLNVWTSEWPPSARRAVTVWIPGGGNYAFGSSDDVNDGEPLSRRGVIVVTFNYRLGALGFFSHPSLSRESPVHASGNQGILDQIALLQWVRRNIAHFGGDPANVTIFGESAGSLDISVLMTSPLSKGLFHRAIGESGAVVLAGEPLSLSEAEDRGRKAASRWNVPPDASASTLRALSAASILNAEPNLLVPELADLFPNLGITIDGHVFPRRPSEAFANGLEHPVPMLLGNNARENIPGSGAPSDLATAIANVYGPLAPRAQALYTGATDMTYGTPTAQWRTDTSFRCAAVAQVLWHATAGHPTFEYEFARTPSGREATGATHASEVAYVFGTLASGFFGVGPAAKATDVDERLSDRMQQYWTNFAKNGNPNGSGLPNWPKFDVSTRQYMQVTTAGDITVKEGLRRPFCDLFIENLARGGGTPKPAR